MGCLKEAIFSLAFLTLFALTTCDDSAPFIINSLKLNEYKVFIDTREDHYADSNATLTFDGTVEVVFDVDRKYENNFHVVLNSDPKSEIKSVRLLADNQNLPVSTNFTKGRLTVSGGSEYLKYKQCSLKINYSNAFGSDMTGLYRSSYESKKSGKRWLLTTQLEPIAARKVFPCFDEPHIKAFVTVKIAVPKKIVKNNYIVLCNTPVKPPKEAGDKVEFECEKTLSPMSSYLVAFTVADFISTGEIEFISTYKSNLMGEKRKLNTYGQEEIIKKGEGELSQIIAKEAFDLLTKYTQIGYAFKKMDQVGIPDFSAGAMENWGHVSFREKSLFFNKDGATLTKQANVVTITHELVHQWFGNLVTLESWDYIWLNEAFATYFGWYIASQMRHPKINTQNWKMMEQFVVNEMFFRAFETDGLNTSKPMSNHIVDENLIFSSFNDIPYSKAASVVRMWDGALKNNGLQKSLQLYLEARKENSGNPEQLYDDGFKKGVKMEEAFFTSWHKQPGYPVVQVKRINATQYKLSQNRFLWENSPTEDKTKWVVPISFTTSESLDFSTEPKNWLRDADVTITAAGKWIIVNNQQSGYYRVNYEKENWIALSDALKQDKFSKIPELNRAQIINDVFGLARSVQKDYIDYTTALSLTEYLGNENSVIVWKTAFNAFDFLKTKLYGDETSYKKFTNHILRLLVPHFKEYNLISKKEEHADKIMSLEISRWACSLDYPECLKLAAGLYTAGNLSRYPDTQEIILCTAVKTNNSIWNEIFEKYQKESDSALKVMYLSVLGCSTNKATIEDFLNKSLDPTSKIRNQDLMFVLSSVYSGNLDNVDKAFSFVEKKYEEISKVYGGINPLGRALVGLAKKMHSPKDIERMSNLAKKILASPNPELKAAKESVENALSIMTSNKKWVDLRLKQVKDYFK